MKSTARFLLLLLLLSQASCKKDKSPDPGPLYIPQEVKDYAQFKPGTYWVYIDSVSGRVDSVYVKSYKWGYDTLEIYDNPKRAYEWFETIAHSEMDGYDYNYYCSTSYSTLPNSKIKVVVSKYKPGAYKGENIYLFFTFQKAESVYYYDSHFIVKDFVNEYTASGIVFKNVIQLFHDISIAEPSNNVTNFIASHYGTIRKEYADSNQVWVLARSNIIQ